MAADNEWATVRVVQAAHKTAEDLSAHYLAPGSRGVTLLDLAICCFDGFKLAANATRIRGTAGASTRSGRALRARLIMDLYRVGWMK